MILYASLGRYHPQSKKTEPFTLTFPVGTTVDGLLKKLGIDGGVAKQVFVEHLARPREFRLQDGQRVAIFPPIAGG